MKLSLKRLSVVLSFVAIGGHYALIAQDIPPWILSVAVTFLPFMPLFLFLPAVMWAVLSSYTKQLPLVDFICHVGFYVMWVLAGVVYLTTDWGLGRFVGYGPSVVLLLSCIAIAVWRGLGKTSPKEWFDRRKRLIGTFAAIGAILLLTYTMVDIPARARFSTAAGYMTTIDQSVVTASGRQKSALQIQGDGSVWQRYGCGLFYSCPFVAREWSVAVEPGAKLALAHELFAKINYAYGPGECYGDTTHWFCYLDGKGADFKMTIEMWPSEQPPTQATDSKIWADLRVTLQAGAQ